MIVENKIELRKINDIRPYIRNPRRNEETVRKLVKLIPKVGFNVPIVIDSKGIIVKGHARYSAAIKLGMDEVPCIVSHASEEDIRIDRITDNKISEYSEWINEEVQQELEELNVDIDFSDLGFPVARPDDVMLASEQPPEPPSVPYSAPSVTGQPTTPVQMPPQVDTSVSGQTQPSVPTQPSVSSGGSGVQTGGGSAGKGPTKKYYKYICKDCGHVMFIPEEELLKKGYSK